MQLKCISIRLIFISFDTFECSMQIFENGYASVSLATPWMNVLCITHNSGKRIDRNVFRYIKTLLHCLWCTNADVIIIFRWKFFHTQINDYTKRENVSGEKKKKNKKQIIHNFCRCRTSIAISMCMIFSVWVWNIFICYT